MLAIRAKKTNGVFKTLHLATEARLIYAKRNPTSSTNRAVET